MQKNAISGNANHKELIKAIKDANKFSEILSLIDKFHDRHLSTEKAPTATKIAFKAVVFFGSYFHADANFIYSLPTLKNEIVNYAVEQGYELLPQPDSSYSCN